MSDCVKTPRVATPGLRKETSDAVFALLSEKFAAVRDADAPKDFSVVVDASKVHDVIRFLRDDKACGFDMLLDIVGVDYLGFKDYEGPRFAVEYLLKNVYDPAKRIRVKAKVAEGASVPTVSDLFPIADWQEREVWDQYGIVFAGHPDLRRLLNHAEFVGHPLRKDYPAQKRQWLSTNDYLLPALEKKLESMGYRIVKRSKEVMTNDDEYLEGSIRK
ncbi:MAG: NADH-quinone oxidoreductase subunit C [Fibrobacteraceae bacterium]